MNLKTGDKGRPSEDENVLSQFIAIFRCASKAEEHLQLTLFVYWPSTDSQLVLYRLFTDSLPTSSDFYWLFTDSLLTLKILKNLQQRVFLKLCELWCCIRKELTLNLKICVKEVIKNNKKIFLEKSDCATWRWVIKHLKKWLCHLADKCLLLPAVRAPGPLKPCPPVWV